jgi:two-component system, sensor histidine kinase FlrB
MTLSQYQTCAVKPQITLSEWDVLSSLPNALVILNALGGIVWLNPSAEAMLGYGLIGSLWVNVIAYAFVPRDDDGHEVSLADGRRVHVAIASLDSLPGTLVTLSDITQTRDYEKAKEYDNRLLSIGTMTAQLAHQIRTPLSSAMLYTEHLNNLDDMDARTKTWIKRLQECHSSIEEQIQDLLLFARGTFIKPEHLSMDVWCGQLSHRVEVYAQSFKALVTVHNQLLYQNATLHGESLMGAVLNLVINALQADATVIQITLASMDDKGIKIFVEDNGKGMSDEIKTKALLPFYTTKAQGTGLGLAVVFSVIKDHGGEVMLESELGRGTRMCLHLPGTFTARQEPIKDTL